MYRTAMKLHFHRSPCYNETVRTMNIPFISLIELSRMDTKVPSRRFDCVSYKLVLIVVKQATEG